MATYLISYDLQGPDGDYETLIDAIKTYRAWAHVNESVWAVVTGDSAPEVRDYLAGFLDPGDRLFVLRSGGAAAWRNVICKNEWLKKNL